jgi:hypothetical protein
MEYQFAGNDFGSGPAGLIIRMSLYFIEKPCQSNHQRDPPTISAATAG